MYARFLCYATLAALFFVAARADTISGSATYRERIALPADAVLEISVEDVSRADAPAQVVARATVRPSGQVPIAFTVEFDPRQIDPTHRYAVRAQLLASGRLEFTTTRAYPVLTHGANTALPMLLLQRVRHDDPAPERGLVNTYWKLTRLGDDGVTVSDNLPEPHLILSASQGRVSGSGGCNMLSGAYTLVPPRLGFDHLLSTLRECLSGMDQEQRFLKSLAAVRGYRVNGETLVLIDEAGASLAQFVAVDRQ